MMALANALAHEVLGHSLDELPPQTRRLLQLVDAHVRDECERQAIARSAYRFSRRTLREAIGSSDTQLRVHLERLVELEYVIARRDGPGGKFVYELAYDGGGADGRPFVPGLIEVETLAASTTTQERGGLKGEVAGQLRPTRSPVAGGSRGEANAANRNGDNALQESAAESAKTHSSSADAENDVIPLAAGAGR